jgi:hypothetical protein
MTSVASTASGRSNTNAPNLFAEDWERRAFRLMIGSIGPLGVNGCMFRHSVERMDPAHYLSSSYYEHWLTGVTTLAVEAGAATVEELERRAGGRFPLSRPDRGVLPDDITPRTEPRYSIGDEVRVREWHPPGHTRAPRYVQGKRPAASVLRELGQGARVYGCRARAHHACGARRCRADRTRPAIGRFCQPWTASTAMRSPAGSSVTR